MWKLDLEDVYYRIYDSKRQIAGYFDPDYGELFPKENELEIIERMHKNHDKVQGGFLMVPMIKFEIFDRDYDSNIEGLSNQLQAVNGKIAIWKEFIEKTKNYAHSIRISHTDRDMLSITFPFAFSKPTPLDKKDILVELEPILNLMQQQGLL